MTEHDPSLYRAILHGFMLALGIIGLALMIVWLS